MENYIKSGKKVCVITSELSSQTAGTPRLERIVRYLLVRGCEVSLIDTSSFFSYKEYTFNNITDYNIFRENVMSNIRFKNGSRTGITAQFLRKLKHLFLLDFICPSFLFRICKIFFNKKPNLFYKYIIASSPTPQNIILSYLLKKINKKTFINVDFRDEWALHSHIYSHRNFRKYIERKILFNSDIITTVSNSIKKKLENEYNIKGVKVIYNYSKEFIDLIPSHKKTLVSCLSKSKINCLYVGTMPDGYYNERLFLYFLDQLKYYGIINNFSFNFIGFKGKLKEKIIKNGYGDIFVFYPPMKHGEILYLMKHVDVLLFFAYDKPDNGGIVSTKLLEYLNSGTRVLPFSIKKDSDVDFLFEKICEKTMRLNSKEDIERLLSKENFHEQLPSKKNDLYMQKMEMDNFDNIDFFLTL